MIIRGKDVRDIVAELAAEVGTGGPECVYVGETSCDTCAARESRPGRPDQCREHDRRLPKARWCRLWRER